MSTILHVAFVGALLGTEAFSLRLAVLNVRYTRQTLTEERDWLARVLGMDDANTLAQYVQSQLGLQVFRLVALAGWTITVLYAGGLGRIVETLESTGWPYLLRGTVFLVLVTLAYWLVSLPFDAYEEFVDDDQVDSHESSPTAWARGALIELTLSLVLTAVLGVVLLWFVEAFQRTWWLALWILTASVTVLMQVLYPRVIAPMFHDLTPVEDEALGQAVEEVFERADVENVGVYVADTDGAERKSAYFSGIGSLGRVVLYDGLVETMDEREIQSIVAHELAHRERRHTLKRVVASGVKNFLVYGTMYVVWSTGIPAQMFAIPTEATYASLIVAALWTAPVSRLSVPLKNRLTQSNEYEADTYAVDVMGGSEPLADALTRLSGEGFTNPFPHPLYAAFNREHPSIPERIRNLREDGHYVPKAESEHPQ